MTSAVVIPCRDEAAHIQGLLDAIAAQTSPPTEVVVVDDQSTDATVDLVREWHSRNPQSVVRIVPGAGRGPGPAMNTGIASTEADVIIRLDGHSIPAPEYLEHSLTGVQNNGVGVVGGVWRILPGAPGRVARSIAGVVSHPLGSGGAAYRHADATGAVQRVVETVPFGAFRRSTWERLGGFDETLAANEDFDFNFRVRKAGLDVVLDRRIQATYFARATLATLGRQYYRYGFWKRQMLRKAPSAIHWRQIPPMLVLPWVLVTTAWALTTLSSVGVAAALFYPVVLVVGAGHLALRGHSFVACLGAFATAHLAWGLGFWRGLLHLH